MSIIVLKMFMFIDVVILFLKIFLGYRDVFKEI